MASEMALATRSAVTANVFGRQLAPKQVPFAGQANRSRPALASEFTGARFTPNRVCTAGSRGLLSRSRQAIRCDSSASTGEKKTEAKPSAPAAEKAAAAEAKVEEVYEEEEEAGLVDMVLDFADNTVATIESLPGPRMGPVPALVGVPLSFLGVTFVIAVVRYVRKWLSPQQKRSRKVNKNRYLIDEIDKFLPKDRLKLTPVNISALRLQTGFTGEEIFRKYLRFLLNERPFDEEAISDVLHLRSVCGLTDDQVAEALNESARRTYEKTGVVMIRPKGFTLEGLKRKATGRTMFSKLLYLSELDELLPPGSSGRSKADIPAIFGATEDDTNMLRIPSLVEFDVDKLEQMLTSMGDDDGDGDSPAGQDGEQAEGDNKKKASG